MSNFTRKINDFRELKVKLTSNVFLTAVYKLVKNGEAFLSFRNDEATIYYNGQQLCNLTVKNKFEPSIYNQYLPITRSRLKMPELNLKKRNFLENEWLEDANLSNLNFAYVLNEIKDNIEKDSSP